ncbi:MAG: OmpA family protein [Halobacteriovoraceae bacterium]|nr:OmpA family protein [Halobacteriovoraceae bacterium]MCB9095254.1 OmpA family protein [Halobacteriovoraceae bacterium]
MKTKIIKLEEVNKHDHGIGWNHARFERDFVFLVLGVFAVALFIGGIYYKQFQVQEIPVTPMNIVKVHDEKRIQKVSSPKIEKVKKIEPLQRVIEIQSWRGAAIEIKYAHSVINFPGLNFFHQSSFHLINSRLKILIPLINYLKKNPGQVSIIAHTDGVSPYPREYRAWNTNQELSMLRGNSIKNFLRKEGIDHSRLEILSYDEKSINYEISKDRGLTFIVKNQK